MVSKIFNIKQNGDFCYLSSPLLECCDGVAHAFSTRHGGVSEGHLSSMNVSFNLGDKRENVLENYNRLAKSIGSEISHLCLSKQVHDNVVRCVTVGDIGTGIIKPEFENADALITNDSNVALIIHYADCTPILLCDSVTGAIGAVHSGWRGTAGVIVANAVKAMGKNFGSKPQNIKAAIGPCIGQCCYEVDGTVYNAFKKAGYYQNGIFENKPNGKYMLDLKRANYEILISCGVRDENIDVCDICTCCNSDDFFSHRATSGKRGTLAAIIERK